MTGTRARVRQGSRYGKVGVEYEIVQFTDNAEWVLRDPDNDVIVFEDDGYVEVRCERCGRWSRDAIVPVLNGDGWQCIDGCEDAS